MAIRFRCVNPSCRAEQQADARMAGRLVWCGHCHLALRVPRPSNTPGSASPPDPADPVSVTPRPPQTPGPQD